MCAAIPRDTRVLPALFHRRRVGAVSQQRSALPDLRTGACRVNGRLRLNVFPPPLTRAPSQFYAEGGEVEGLTGRNATFNQDTANDPQVMITQLTEVDYEASPRRSVTYNWTRSVFEEVVRRRDELRRDLVRAIDKLKESRAGLDVGLEPDANGQIWLIIAMHQTEVTRLEKLYNETLQRDRNLYLEHTREYVAILPHNDHGSACDNRLRLTPAAPTRRGSVWYKKPQRVTHGFTTTFRFQLTARNRFYEHLAKARADRAYIYQSIDRSIDLNINIDG